MPKCANCPQMQARLNKGDLCRICFDKHNESTENNKDDNYILIG